MIDIIAELKKQRQGHVQQIETIDAALEILNGNHRSKRHHSAASKARIARGVRRAARARRKENGK